MVLNVRPTTNKMSTPKEMKSALQWAMKIEGRVLRSDVESIQADALEWCLRVMDESTGSRYHVIKSKLDELGKSQ